jgi:predicted membrane channel-forming protein YqfA (hemolysin III family)
MLASLIAAFASGEAMNAVHRAKVTAIAYLLAAIAGLCGLGFLVGAAYIVAARKFGDVEAAISFGVGLLLITLLILAVRSIAARSRARRARRRGVDLATIAGVAAVSMLPALLKSRAGIIAPIVALAAYAIYRENQNNKPDDPEKP